MRSLSKLFHFDPSKSELLLDTKWEKVVIQQVPLPPQSYWPTYTEDDPSGEFSRAVSGWLEDITMKSGTAPTVCCTRQQTLLGMVASGPSHSWLLSRRRAQPTPSFEMAYVS
ncbi:hypothetical protein EV715DRAFT_294337 [Schizophyllum commune]